MNYLSGSLEPAAEADWKPNATATGLRTAGDAAQSLLPSVPNVSWAAPSELSKQVQRYSAVGSSTVTKPLVTSFPHHLSWWWLVSLAHHLSRFRSNREFFWRRLRQGDQLTFPDIMCKTSQSLHNWSKGSHIVSVTLSLKFLKFSCAICRSNNMSKRVI